MAKKYKQSSSLLTQCFRPSKTSSTSLAANNNAAAKKWSLSNTYSFSAVVETIQTIDQLVQSAKDDYDKQPIDPCSTKKTMNIEQIEGMLVKWTRIGHFLVETYQQMQGINEPMQKPLPINEC